MQKDGSFLGPLGVLMHTPELGHLFLEWGNALGKLPGLSAQSREIAVLAVGARTQAAYQNYAHSKLSGMSTKDLENIQESKLPSDATEENRIVLNVIDELFKPGPLSKEIWDEAVRILGIQGMTTLVHYVGFYKYTSTILNGFDAQVPEESSEQQGR